MRKTLMAALLAIVMCLAALSGCAMVRGFEKDVQVVLMVNGEYRGSYTVNAFNNAIVPVPEAPQGLMFYGWTADENWEEKGAANVKVSANKGLIRYDDVKDYAGEKLSVTLYPVFGEIPRHDIAIAWYDKAATSGLNSAVIDGFTSKFYAFLTEKGYETKEMDIVIRSYAGNVGPTCEAIRGDGDIDIMIGWSHTKNLSVDAGSLVPGKDFLENNGNILINPNFEKGARYSARMNDKELTHLVYDWILETYSGEGGPKLDYLYTENPEEPDPPEEPDTPVYESELVVGWYSKTGTSGLDTTVMRTHKKALYAYLESEKIDLANTNVIIRAYNGDVADVQNAVTADGDVDLMLGMKKFELEGVTMEVQNDVAMGSTAIEKPKTDRRIHLVSESKLAKLVFEWLKTDGARGSLVTDQTPATESKIVIGWYAKTDNSGLDESIIANFKTALETYLTAQGYNLGETEIVLRQYDGKVADVQNAVTADGDVDLMLGMKAFALSGVEMEVQNDVAMGTKTDRRIHLVSDGGLANAVFEWLKDDAARSSLVVA